MATVDYPGAIPYFVDDSRVFTDNNTIEAIVLHGTGGSADQTVEGLGDWFRSDTAMASSHFGVGRNGRIAQYVKLKDGAAANCCTSVGYDPFWTPLVLKYSNLNLCTVSIEFVNDITNSLALTSAQQDAGFALIKWLSTTYSIPFSRIKGHFSIDPVNRSECPGPQFPWTNLETALKGASMLQLADVSGYFPTGDDNRWICKNGNAIAYGILNFYRQYGGGAQFGLTYLGLPVSGEAYPLQGVAVQKFERGMVVYDPARKLDNPPGASGDCYLSHIEGYYAQADQVAHAQTEIATLQAQLATAQKVAPNAVAMQTAISQARAILDKF